MKKISILLIALMVISVGLLSGCEELEELNKPDYIWVHVYCHVKVVIHNDSDTSLPAKGVFVKLEIIKAGGERRSERFYTDAQGTTSLSEIVQLYREQPITCIANVDLESAEQFPGYTFNGASHTISWNEIYPANDFGDKVYKDVNLVIHGYKKEN